MNGTEQYVLQQMKWNTITINRGDEIPGNISGRMYEINKTSLI